MSPADTGRRSRSDTGRMHGNRDSRQDGYASPTETTAPNHYAQASRADHSDYSRDNVRYRAAHSKPRKRRVGLVVAIVIVLVLAAGASAFGLWYSNIVGNLRGDADIDGLAEVTGDEPYYVLLLGGDSRVDEKTDNRSDSIMVARVDEKNQKVSLLSIPRDLRINMGEHGYQKINAAIEFGGYDYVIEIVNQLLDIQINYYAFIYFDGFEDLVDKLGGVTVEVPAGTYYAGVSVPAGDAVQIDGKEALVLARCRHGNPPDQGAYVMGDYQRTKNQRNLIKAIGKKVLQSDLTKMPDLIEGLSECVETNMSPKRIISLAQNMRGMDVDDIETEQLPIAGVTISGSGWCAALYEDVFEVMRDDFTSGKDLREGLAGFDEMLNGNNVGSDYTDGDLYCYTLYADKYGDFSVSTDASGDADADSDEASDTE